MDYCAGIWSYGTHNDYVKIQQRAIRYYLGVHSKAPLLAIEGDIGWIDTQIRQNVEMLRFWNRVIKMDDARLTRKIFDFDYSNNNSVQNWSSNIRELFRITNNMTVFVNKSTCDIKEMRDSLISHYSEKWRTEIQRKPKL